MQSLESLERWHSQTWSGILGSRERTKGREGRSSGTASLHIRGCHRRRAIFMLASLGVGCWGECTVTTKSKVRGCFAQSSLFQYFSRPSLNGSFATIPLASKVRLCSKVFSTYLSRVSFEYFAYAPSIRTRYKASPDPWKAAIPQPLVCIR